MPSAGGAVSSDESDKSDGSDALPKLTGSLSIPASVGGATPPKALFHDRLLSKFAKDW